MISEPLRPLVERVLSLAGVEHEWRADDLVLVRAHAAFGELFGDAPALELALSEAAAQRNPAAILCVPGSFALDQLLQWVRSGPCAFRTRLAAAPPAEALPPGLPEVANAKLAVRDVETDERPVLYALFRVSLQSDELVERLVALAFDGDGTPRPELVARLEMCERAGGSVPAALPDALLEAIEAEAGRAAREVARAYVPVVAARKARELERLERFLRALRDDLQGALPAGAARRAAQIRARGRATLDALASVLAGEGPWERDGLLLTLRPRFGRARRNDPAGYLAPDVRAAVSDLIARLPAQFTLPDAEACVSQETEARLARLDRRAREEQAPSAVLDEGERRLQEEHRARVADIESKFHLRVLVRPVVLECLDSVMLRYRLVVAGSGTAELAATWDVLAEAWQLPPCPGCGAAIQRVWLCERGHLACEGCVTVCRRCARARCPACALARCALCREAACEGCGAACDRCGGWSCDRHFVRCPECGRTTCRRCGGACYACESALCAEHRRACAICERGACPEHGVLCHRCQRAACRDHGDVCPACSRPYCGDHAAACRFCGQRYCVPCVAGPGQPTCATCRSLAEVGPATAEALRSRLRDSAPGIDPARFRALWLARNSRYWIVVGRRWPWNHVFVLKEGTRELVSVRRYWSWRGL